MGVFIIRWLQLTGLSLRLSLRASSQLSPSGSLGPKQLKFFKNQWRGKTIPATSARKFKLSRRKKRKCDRQRPKCSSCVASRLECHYLPSKTLEDRLENLEQMLSQKVNFDFVSSTEPNTIPVTDKVKTAILQQDNIDLKLRGAKITTFDLINPELVLTLNNPVIDNAAKCLGSLRSSYIFHMDGNLNPENALLYKRNNVRDAFIYYEKAVSYFSQTIAHQNPVSVLALLYLAVACLGVDRISEGLSYYTLAVQMAKFIGLNKEEHLDHLASHNYDKEQLRAVWWSLYMFDRFSFQKNTSLINDEENLLYLPNTVGHMANYSMQIMSSPEWFTPTLPEQSLHSLRIILYRIMGRTLRFNYLTRYEPNHADLINPIYNMLSLDASLREWWRQIPPDVVNQFKLVQTDICIPNPQFTWSVILDFVQFYHVKTMVFR